MNTKNIQSNYRNIKWYAEQLNHIATEYLAHAGKETFIDQTLVKGNVKHLRTLARCLTSLAKNIETENN